MKRINYINTFCDMEFDEMFQDLEIEEWFFQDRFGNSTSIKSSILLEQIKRTDNRKQGFIIRQFKQKRSEQEKLLFFTWLAKIYTLPQHDESKIKVINIKINGELA
ncbi:hypothetical protein H5203_21335 [Pseudoalteromonas sp. SG41-1]|uniref:hypothetical protein n=1 Tax=Pseudoalteromonas sp. SG41-1 TaxID=2760979 RepID=UPI001600E7C3|nr:hypothetical protein [Pseudoalteromonas sp. SG41-1]MBB1507990.1 hypothetical protein [Pseudoalteromonas sp. SG41-1]